MKRILIFLLFLTVIMSVKAQTIYAPDVHTLQATVNGQWLQMPIMRLHSDDLLEISFDQLSHEYHRYRYEIQHLEADGTPSRDLFESDYIEGFSHNYIEDYKESLNTNQLYTHYTLQIPNSLCRPKMSGNYLLTVFDEENDNQRVLEVPFYVVEPLMSITLQVSTNTDIDVNQHHQQVSMSVDYGSIRVTDPARQIYTVIRQNGLCQGMQIRVNPRPNIIGNHGLQWSHHRELIFKAGNEFRKFEILDTDRPSTGVDRITWDGAHFNAWLFPDEVRRQYLTDKDANGAFLIRNSNDSEIDYTCDYLQVHFTLKAPYNDISPRLVGAWTTSNQPSAYDLQWDNQLQVWHTSLLLKQGYYSYQYIMPWEENFYQTENTYQAFVYYRDNGDRTWRLMGCATLTQ